MSRTGKCLFMASTFNLIGFTANGTMSSDLIGQPGIDETIDTVICLRSLTEAGYVVRVVHDAWWRVVLPEQRPSTHNRWLVARRRDG